MVLLIHGSTHTGKTVLSQKLLEKMQIPYLSIDHLKMGLIRSKQTELSVCDDDKLTDYLWPILCEIIKTVIENRQHLIIEGCYIPFDWQKHFDNSYVKEIRSLCLILSEHYILKHLDIIQKYGNTLEQRMDSYIDQKALICENKRNLSKCQAFHLSYILIEEDYEKELEKGLKALCLSE